MRYIILISVVFTILAIPRGMPYDFFVILRVVNFAIFGFLSYKVQKKNETWMLILGGVALLFNPFIPLHVSKSVWMILDFCTIIIALIFFVKSKFLFQKIKKRNNE